MNDDDDDWLNIGFTLKYPVSGGAGAGVADGGALSVLGQAGVIWHGVTDQRTQTRGLQSLIIIVSAPVSGEHGAPGVVTTLGWAVQLPWDQWWPREAGTHVTTDNNTVSVSHYWAALSCQIQCLHCIHPPYHQYHTTSQWDDCLHLSLDNTNNYNREIVLLTFSRYCRVWSAK